MMMRASTKRVTTLGFCLLCVMLGSLVYQAEGQRKVDSKLADAAYKLIREGVEKKTFNKGKIKKYIKKYKKEREESGRDCEGESVKWWEDRNGKVSDVVKSFEKKYDEDLGPYKRDINDLVELLKCEGCKDRDAENYDKWADEDDDSKCEYDDNGSGGGGGGGGFGGVPGCLDSTANNFNIRATVDDGSCDFSVPGCTSEYAVNYNPAATQNDGSCINIPPQQPDEDDAEEPLPEPECSSEDETCCDTRPPSSVYSCEDEKNFGKCSESWMQGYCAFTCGRCSSDLLVRDAIVKLEGREEQKDEGDVCGEIPKCCERYGKRECAKACKLVKIETGGDQCGANRDQVLDIADESQVKVCKQIPGCCSDPSVDPKQCVRACNEVKKRSGSRRCDAAPDLVKELAMGNQIIEELDEELKRIDEELAEEEIKIEEEYASETRQIMEEIEASQSCLETYFESFDESSVCERESCGDFCSKLRAGRSSPEYLGAVAEAAQQSSEDPQPAPAFGRGLKNTVVISVLEKRAIERAVLKPQIVKGIQDDKDERLQKSALARDEKLNDAKASRDERVKVIEEEKSKWASKKFSIINEATKEEKAAAKERFRTKALAAEAGLSLNCSYANGTQLSVDTLDTQEVVGVELSAIELLDFLNVPREISSDELSQISCTEAEKPKCYPNENNEFIFRVKSVKDQYEVEGCEGVAPTLDMQRGVEYALVQDDLTNWDQPLGLAYYPGGSHTGVPELEQPTPEKCKDKPFFCDPGEGVQQAPLYCVNGTCASSDLDAYQPYFQKSQEEWDAEGPYAVKITIPEASQTIEFYYFSRLHPGMSGMVVVEDSAPFRRRLVVTSEEISPLALLRGGL